MNNIFTIKKPVLTRNDAATNDRRFSPRSLRKFPGDLCGLRFAPESMRISHRDVRSRFDLYVG
jgi:hypothetical protein